MRNLKKILALVLALVMSFSLMATANAFTDDANVDATYDEAVTVLSNLKVFQGYEDGSFQPKGSITRAEVAAIIYRIATGDVTDSQVGIYADYNKFDDVKSTSWYAGYVNYCANAEYIKGYDAKTFGPNDPVTGYQALAMILRAVGYDKNGEFTGSSWQVQTAAVGKQLHITDKVSAGTLGTAATREVVAEILFRSILVPQVTYTPALGYQSIGVSTNGNAWTGWFVDNASIGAETFGLAQTTGEITATNRKTGTTTLTPVTSWWGDDNRLDTANRVDVISTPGDWTQIGYVAYVYTVPTANAKTRTAVSDVTLTGTSLGTSTNGTSIANLSTKGNAAFIAELAGAGTTIRYYYNGVECNAAKAVAAAQNVGVKVDFIDNDNGGLVEVVVVTDYTTAYVTGIANTTNTGSQAVNYNAYNLTTFDGSNRRIASPSATSYDVALAANGNRSVVAVAEANMVCADALAVGDLVTYVEYNGDFYTVKAPLTTDTFSRINYNTVLGSTRSYVVGGTEYLIAAWDVKEYGQTGWYSVAASNLNNANLGKSFNIYTDPYGNIIYAAPVAAAVNYLYVLANDHTVATTGLTNARVVMTDGSITNVNVAKLVTPGYTYTNFNLNDLVGGYGTSMYGYTVNSDGSYNLTELCATLNDADYTAGTSTVYGANGNAGVNTASVVVDVRNVGINSTSATVYTGYSEIPTFTDGVLYYKANNSGWVTVSFLAGGVDFEDNFIVYKTSSNYTENINGTQYYYLDVMVDGVKVENYQLTQAEYGWINYYGVGVYSFNRDGSLKEYTAFTEEWTSVTWQNGSIKDINGNTYYTYDGTNVKFNVLNITGGTINDYTMNYGYDYHAYLVKSGSAVKEIYIVVGTLASDAPNNVATTTATQYKDNYNYTYTVADFYITDHNRSAYATAQPTVVVLDQKGAETGVMSNDAGELTLTWAQYQEYKNTDGTINVVVYPANGNKVSVDQNSDFGAVNAAQKTTVKISVSGQNFYVKSVGTVNAADVQNYKFTAKYVDVRTGNKLYCNGVEVTSPYLYTTATTFDNMVKDFTYSDGATYTWTFYDGAGRVITPNMSTTIDPNYTALATVVAENGAKAEYMIYFDDTTLAVADPSDDLDSLLTSTTGVLRLAPGEYELDATHAVSNDLTIIGMGDVTIKTPVTGTGSNAWAIQVTNNVNLVVKGVNFVNANPEAETAIAIKQTGSGYTFDISDCTFTGYTTAIQLFHSAGGQITGCTFNSQLVDISLWDVVTGTVTISGNTYSANNTDHDIGITASDKDKVIILDQGVDVDYPEG